MCASFFFLRGGGGGGESAPYFFYIYFCFEGKVIEPLTSLIMNSCILTDTTSIDDLRKSRGLHSVSVYRHGLYI